MLGASYVGDTIGGLSGIGRGLKVDSFPRRVVGGLGVVLGRWVGGGPWWVGSGGLSLVGCCPWCCLRGGVPHPRGSASPW